MPAPPLPVPRRRQQAVDPLPLFVNGAQGRPGVAPGDYPSGGPLAHLAREWREGDRLRTIATRPALRVHPVSGELLWFNHAAFFVFHSSIAA